MLKLQSGVIWVTDFNGNDFNCFLTIIKMKRTSVLLASFAIGFILSAFVVDINSFAMFQMKGTIALILLFTAATLWMVSEIRRIQEYIEQKDARKTYLKERKGHGDGHHVES